MDVYWVEQRECDVPLANDWLSASELSRMSAMRIAKRRADWRLGRWTAKLAVASYLNLPADRRALAQIEIRPAPSGAPEAFVANTAAAMTISISHRAGVALCAVAASGTQLGCDLEIVEPRSDAFVSDYFTTEEQALVACASAAERSRLLALLWSAKESALKALREGLRMDTRDVIVSPDESAFGLTGWSRLQARCVGGQTFRGWWRSSDSMVTTMVADPPLGTPIWLKVPARLPDATSLDSHEGSETETEALSTVHS